MNPSTRNFFRTFDLALGILALTVAFIAVTFTAEPASAQTREIPGYVQIQLNSAMKAATVKGDIIPAGKMDLHSVVTLLDHTNHRVAASAAYALGEMRDAAAVPALISALQNDCNHMRRIAAHALGKIGDERAVMPLAEVLRTEQPLAVQASVIMSLGKIGGPDAKQTLTHLNRSPRNWLQQATAEALLKLDASQSFKVAAAE